MRGGAVALQAAGGFVGQGHGDVALRQQVADLLVQFARNAAVAQCLGQCRLAAVLRVQQQKHLGREF